jgi:hypothetical protein
MQYISSGIFLGLAMAMPAMAHAGPAGEQPAAAEQPSATEGFGSLLVVRAEMEGGDAIVEVLREEALAALRASKVAATLPEGAPLEVVVSSDAEKLGAYVVVFRHRGVVLDSWSCTCSGEELRDRLSRTAPEAWRAAAAAGAPAATHEPVAAPQPVAGNPKIPRGRTENGLWTAGMSALAASAVPIVTGSVLVAFDVADHGDPSPSAVGLVTFGVATAATGAVLLGLANRKRKRASMSASVVRGVVLTVGGRF